MFKDVVISANVQEHVDSLGLRRLRQLPYVAQCRAVT